jgi:hypothetical protein
MLRIGKMIPMEYIEHEPVMPSCFDVDTKPKFYPGEKQNITPTKIDEGYPCGIPVLLWK